MIVGKGTCKLREKPRLGNFLSQSLGWLSAAATGLALVLYCFIGTFSRYYADDFCMSGYVIRLGFWQAQKFQYVTWSNRFTGMFLISASDLLGRLFIRYWTSLTILLWGIGLTWAILKIINLLHIQLSRWMPVLLAEWIILFSILLSPQLYQSLFWRVGLITYTLPLAFISFLVGILIQGFNNLQEKKSAWAWLALAGIIAFLGGGLSETYLAIQITFLCLLFLALLIFNKKEVQKMGSKPLGSALIGSLLSFVIVLAAPGNAVRQAAMPAHPVIIEFVKMVVINTFLYIYITLKNNGFQMLLAFLAPMMFVYFAGVQAQHSIRPSSVILIVLISPIILIILAAAVMAPAAFAQSSYPDGRVLMEAAFILVVFLVIEGVTFGLMLNQLHLLAGEPVPSKLQVLSGIIVFIMILYPLYDTYKSIRGIPAYQAYANAWDERDARILAAKETGVTQIVETSLEAPAKLEDINTDPHNWVNVCVEDFYGLASITAKP